MVHAESLPKSGVGRARCGEGAKEGGPERGATKEEVGGESCVFSPESGPFGRKPRVVLPWAGKMTTFQPFFSPGAAPARPFIHGAIRHERPFQMGHD